MDCLVCSLPVVLSLSFVVFSHLCANEQLAKDSTVTFLCQYPGLFQWSSILLVLCPPWAPWILNSGRPLRLCLGPHSLCSGNGLHVLSWVTCKATKFISLHSDILQCHLSSFWELFFQYFIWFFIVKSKRLYLVPITFSCLGAELCSLTLEAYLYQNCFFTNFWFSALSLIFTIGQDSGWFTFLTIYFWSVLSFMHLFLILDLYFDFSSPGPFALDGIWKIIH